MMLWIYIAFKFHLILFFPCFENLITTLFHSFYFSFTHKHILLHPFPSHPLSSLPMPSLCPPMYVTSYSFLNPTHIKYYHLTTPKSLRFHSFKNHIISIDGHNGNRFVPHSAGITSGERDQDTPHSTGSTSGDREDDQETHVIVEKQFSQVMEKGVDELSGDSGLQDQPKLSSRLILITKLLQTKKKLLIMVSSLMAFVVNNIEFVIKPSTHDETDFGVKWNFEWKGIRIHLGQDCSLNIAHVYKGWLFLRKSDATIEPFLHIDPLVSKLEGILMPLLAKIACHNGLIGRRKVVFLYSLSSLVLMSISLILLHKAFV